MLKFRYGVLVLLLAAALPLIAACGGQQPAEPSEDETVLEEEIIEEEVAEEELVEEEITEEELAAEEEAQSAQAQPSPTVAAVQVVGTLNAETLGGSVLDAGFIPLQYALDLGAENQPVIAYSDGEVINVERWDGSTAQMLGEPLGADTDGVLFSSFDASEDGQAIVTYLVTDEEGIPHLRASLYDGTAWTQLGENISLFASGTANFDDSVALTAEGPVVAWRESEDFSQPEQLYVRRWDGSAWQPVGAESINIDPQGDAGVSDIAVLPDGFAIAWQENDTTHVSRWNGSEWQVLPQIEVEGESNDVFLSAGEDGTLAFFHPYNYSVWLLPPGAEEWTELPGLDTVAGPEGETPFTSLDGAEITVVGSDEIYFVWTSGTNGYAAFLRWNGSAWEQLGETISFPELSTSFEAPAAISQDGTLYLTWFTLTGTDGLSITQYTPAQ